MTASKQILLTHLRALQAVAASGSLTRAAEELGYSEPAVHLQLAALRRLLGGPVVVRANGRMELTELGQRILPFAQGATGAVDQLVNEADRVHANQKHVLRIGVGRGTGIYLFPRIADVIGARMPNTSLELFVFPGSEMGRALDENRIDILITTNMTSLLTRGGRRGDDEYAAVPLLRYEWSFVGSPAVAGAIARRQTREIRVLLPEWAAGHLLIAQEYLQANDIQGQVSLAVHTEAAKSAALASNALAFIPRYTARHELISGELTTCLLDGSRHFTRLHVGHRRPARHPDTYDLIVQFRHARELLRELVTVPEIPKRGDVPALVAP